MAVKAAARTAAKVGARIGARGLAVATGPVALGGLSALVLADLLFGATVGASKAERQGLAEAGIFATDFVLPEAAGDIEDTLGGGFLEDLLKTGKGLERFREADTIEALIGQRTLDLMSTANQIADVASKSAPSTAEILATLKSYTNVI